jgi:hypothetical protein
MRKQGRPEASFAPAAACAIAHVKWVFPVEDSLRRNRAYPDNLNFLHAADIAAGEANRRLPIGGVSMSDLNAPNGFSGLQQAAVNTIGTQMLEGASHALRLQADFLQRMEVLTTEFLERQRAGSEAALHLIYLLDSARQPMDLMKVQRESLAGATQRIMGDAFCWQSVGLGMVERIARLNVSETPKPTGTDRSRSLAKAAK